MRGGPGLLAGDFLPVALALGKIAGNFSTLQRPLLMTRPFSVSRLNARWLRHTMKGHAPT